MTLDGARHQRALCTTKQSRPVCNVPACDGIPASEPLLPFSPSTPAHLKRAYPVPSISMHTPRSRLLASALSHRFLYHP
eukprot:6193937-Pleurochrysis_carterae.AAC.2